MRGFSNEFKDFPDYILKITEEIWEGRGLGRSMKSYYHPDVIVRVPAGISHGEPRMTQSTMETVVEFPDRTLFGEDVIWSGTPEEGMLSSHRLFSTATHHGGRFGPATGLKVTFRGIADCYAKDNQISDEWLVRDNGAVARQLGFTPEAFVLAELEAGREVGAFVPENDVEGPYTGRGNDDPYGARYAGLLERVMEADIAVIHEEWDRACQLEYPGGLSAAGRTGADAFWLGLRSALPGAEFKIHHVIGREDPMMPPRAAIRWSLDGAHDGWGTFGRPSGKRVHVMGISHAEFGPWGLRREWVCYDELAIWGQILS
ncbi:MAG: nuclear transport factor 2 family protein [Pseudomonadota bacterium]